MDGCRSSYRHGWPSKGFTSLIGRLRAEVHARGSLLTGDELLAQATGRPLDPEVFKAHLAARYLGE